MTLPDSILRALASCEEQYPYLSAALDAMPVRVSDEAPIAACSQTGTIYLRPEAMAELGRSESGGVVAHEIWHYLSEHFNRVGDRDHTAWNIATDCEINDDLGALPSGALMPSTIGDQDGKLAEDYYQGAKLCEGLEQHVSGSAADGVSKEWETKEGGGLSDDAADELRDATAQAIKAAGLQGGVDKWATDRLKVKVPSFSVRLRTAVRKSGAVPNDIELTYSKPSRRESAGIIRAGTVKDSQSVLVMVDSSGSIACGDSPVVMGALRTLASRFGEIEWVLADTEIRARGKKLPDVMAGGGGTDLRRCLKTVDDEGHSAIIVVTDGYTPWPAKDEMRTPYVAVLTNEYDVPDYIQSVVIGDAATLCN